MCAFGFDLKIILHNFIQISMKRFLLFPLIISALISSCTNDEDFYTSDSNKKSVVLTALDFISSEQTRSTISSDLKFSWSNGDAIGIYPSNGDQIRFPIMSNSSGSTATFDGGGWALKNAETYYAYYPYSAENIINNNKYDAIAVDYTKQTQVGINSNTHLSDIDYMYAKSEAQNGNIHFDFKHANSILHLELNGIPNGTIINDVTISSDGDMFTKTGYLDCATGKITTLSASNSQTIHLENATIGTDGKLDVWMMIAPTDLSQKSLRITAIDNDGEEYFICVSGNNYKAGYAYLISSKPDATPYVRFESTGYQTLKLSNRSNNTHKVEGDLYYSVGDGNWSKLSIGQEVDFGGDYGDLRLRGKLPKGTAYTNDEGIYESYKISFLNYSIDGVACHGDIRTLVDYEDYKNQEGDNVSFYFLFEDCEQLTSIPDLPFRKLGKYCYAGLFRGCSRLVEPLKALDVDEMDYACCYSMFSNCTSLTQAPELPCKNISEACYQWMFGGCTSLVEAPELPALILKGYCYNRMFYGCTKLNYIKMMGSKIETSNIKTQLCFEEWCYNVPSSGTFYYNSDAEWLTNYSSYVFPNYWTKKSIDTTPYLTFSAETEQFLMVEEVGSGYISNNINYSLDDGQTWAVLSNKAVKFGGANGPLKLKGRMANGTAESKSHYLKFRFLIDDVPVKCGGDMRTIVNHENYRTASYSNVRFCGLFSDCKQLISAPKLSLPEGVRNTADYCYAFMFKNCESLIEAPEIPASNWGLSPYCYYEMFYGCTNLRTAPKLPATTAPNFCYYRMFMSCSNLQTPPDLPAYTIGESCYESMFQYCTSLTRRANLGIRGYGNDEDDEPYPTNWNMNMYAGCTSL